VQVLDPESRTVVDQFPAEDIVKRRAARDAAREAATSDNDLDGLRA